MVAGKDWQCRRSIWVARWSDSDLCTEVEVMCRLQKTVVDRFCCCLCEASLDLILRHISSWTCGVFRMGSDISNFGCLVAILVIAHVEWHPLVVWVINLFLGLIRVKVAQQNVTIMSWMIVAVQRCVCQTDCLWRDNYSIFPLLTYLLWRSSSDVKHFLIVYIHHCLISRRELHDVIVVYPILYWHCCILHGLTNFLISMLNTLLY